MIANYRPAVSGLPLDERPPLVPDLRTLADTAKRDGEGHGGDLVFFLAFAVFLAAAVGSTTHARCS
jgi:hypothetical protein